ncbi:MAG: chromosome segregation protein SMC, partial [Clostridia bacterium]|nr:chromosome segregation protein SMC [Clostridia bacterium]
MYLKSIEVHGFKSFANKIVFKFHNGITGIVGPNGSGKSNVADAVRWVLGEQRVKQLRGASMQDVIFSGTETRKPMGYAYVAITLDNSDHQLAIDFEEVTVSRRVYRSGESEYLINGAICRLKDVYELFYDTGIGKEGYSIIGQGQIDQILSGKPEDRRELFDEAAGIVKFKRRKDTAVKKLAEEKANLVRVSDILSELEKQVEPLEKQSEIAKDYLKKKEALKVLDVNMFLLEAERIKNQLVEIDEKIKIADSDFKSAKEQYENTRAEYEKIDNELEMLDRMIEEKRQLVSDTGLMRGKLEGEINVLKEQIKAAENNSEHYNNRIQTIESQLKTRESEKEQILSEKSELDVQLEELTLKRDEAKKFLSDVQQKILLLNTGIENGKNEIIGLLNARSEIRARVGRCDSMIEQNNIKNAEIQSRLLRAKSDEAEQKKQLDELYQVVNEINSEIMALDSKAVELEETTAKIKKEIEQIDKELENCQVTYHKEKSKLEALKNLNERYEGYGNSIKKVMEQKEQHAGIIGVVADIIHVDKAYETAIEIALGGNIQNIVTKDEKTAKEMIRFLKENRLGRATFLPLTSVKDRGEFNRPDALKEEGVIGIASTLVKTNDQYKDVVGQLLGAILVVDHIDHAIALAKKYNYMLRIVTKEGEYLTPGGAMAGGAFKNNSNLLGRKREIEALEQTIRECSQKIDVLTGQIDQKRQERKQLREQSEELREKQQETYIRQNTAQMNVDQALARQQTYEQGFKDLEQENKDLLRLSNEVKDEKEKIQEELLQSETREAELEQLIREYGDQLAQVRDDENDKVLNASELDLDVANMTQKREFCQQNLDRVIGEITGLQNEIAEVNIDIAETENEIKQKQENIVSIEDTIKASIESVDENKLALDQAIETKDALNARQKNFFKIREDLSEKINALDKE